MYTTSPNTDRNGRNVWQGWTKIGFLGPGLRDLGRPQQRRKYQEHIQDQEEQILMDSNLTVPYEEDDDVKTHISLPACHHVMKSCVGRQKILL